MKLKLISIVDIIAFVALISFIALMAWNPMELSAPSIATLLFFGVFSAFPYAMVRFITESNETRNV